MQYPTTEQRIKDALALMQQDVRFPAPDAVQTNQPSVVLDKKVIISWQISHMYGWGVYGYHLAMTLLRLGGQPILLHPPHYLMANAAQVADLNRVAAQSQRYLDFLRNHPGQELDAPDDILLMSCDSLFDFKNNRIRSGRDIGIAFFDRIPLPPENVRKAQDVPLIITGSAWNERVLRDRYHLANVKTIIQGVDTAIFHPAEKKNRLLPERFVIFSGCKLEYRKGQDIVMEAFKRFHGRHPDAFLLTTWHNHWINDPSSRVQYAFPSGYVTDLPDDTDINPWLGRYLPAGSFYDTGMIPNPVIPQLLHECDAAILPSRCEGGTNLVAMECMAAGVPLILSANTGHLDLIAPDRCYPVMTQKPVNDHHGVLLPDWGESSVDEIVERLEDIYQNRARARAKAQKGWQFIRQFSWHNQCTEVLQAVHHSAVTPPVSATAVAKETAPTPTAAQWLLQGEQLVSRGDHGAARSCYQRALAIDQHCSEAWNNLGLLLMSQQDFNAAVPYFEQAIALRLSNVLAHNNLASAFVKLGLLPKAIVEYEYALVLRPDQAIRNNLIQALLALGNRYHEQDRIEEADRCYRRTVALNPDHSEARTQLGILALAEGRLTEAADHCRVAAQSFGLTAADLQRRGVESYHQGRILEATAWLIQTLVMQPQHPGHYNNLGLILAQLGYHGQAVKYYEQALRIKPESNSYNNLGTSLHRLGRMRESEACFKQAIAMQPDYAQAHHNLGFNLAAQYRIPESAASFAEAFRLVPGDHTAMLYHMLQGDAWLAEGRYREGWKELTWFWYQRQYRRSLFSDDLIVNQEPWNGTDDLAGKHLLVVTGWEGLGDAIQLVRYVPQLAKVCGAVITLLCQPVLVPLFATVAQVHAVKPREESWQSMSFDAYVPLIALPTILDIPFPFLDVDPVTRGKPYLTVMADVREHWQRRLQPCLAEPGLKVGLCWAGGDKTPWGRARHIEHVEKLWPLFGVSNVKFYSFQMDADDQTLRRFPPGRLHSFGSDLKGFMNTAAILSQMDLLITIDSAITHLAGAIGFPTWLLLPAVTDYRWLCDRADSPWYSSLRLFRQREAGDWDGVIERVVVALQQMASASVQSM
ncbi:MAG: tetratricopeptide repeat protein [Magnetococcales bacterium]|nr:tetratricopeptide repeat protein [Magnetococcales bacterium]